MEPSLNSVLGVQKINFRSTDFIRDSDQIPFHKPSVHNAAFEHILIYSSNPIMITTLSSWSWRSDENKTKFGTQKALIRKQKALQLIHFPQNLCSALNFVLWHFEIFEIFLLFPAPIKLPQKKILSFGSSPDFKCKTAAFISSALSLHPRSNNNANLNLGLERSRVPWLLNFYNFYFQFS